MNELIRLLTGWREAAQRGDEYFNPPGQPPGGPAQPQQRPSFPEGATEAEKLRIAREWEQKKRQPPPPPPKSWWQMGLWDLFR